MFKIVRFNKRMWFIVSDFRLQDTWTRIFKNKILARNTDIPKGDAVWETFVYSEHELYELLDSITYYEIIHSPEVVNKLKTLSELWRAYVDEHKSNIYSQTTYIDPK